jgi:hypothetical protein
LAVSGATGAPEFGEKTDRVMSDGLVLAKNAGYDYWVRRAPAIEAMAIPPINPTSTTTHR